MMTEQKRERARQRAIRDAEFEEEERKELGEKMRVDRQHKKIIARMQKKQKKTRTRRKPGPAFNEERDDWFAAMVHQKYSNVGPNRSFLADDRNESGLEQKTSADSSHAMNSSSSLAAARLGNIETDNRQAATDQLSLTNKNTVKLPTLPAVAYQEHQRIALLSLGHSSADTDFWQGQEVDPDGIIVSSWGRIPDALEQPDHHGITGIDSSQAQWRVDWTKAGLEWPTQGRSPHGQLQQGN
jgi:hypothetical protein